MWNCQHAECHNPADCAICSQEGTTWCPHRECRYQNPEGSTPTVEQPQSAGTRGIVWTPTVAGQFLKFAFVAAAAAGAWWLLHSGGSALPEEGDPLSPEAPGPADDFSSWEPES